MEEWLEMLPSLDEEDEVPSDVYNFEVSEEDEVEVLLVSDDGAKKKKTKRSKEKWCDEVIGYNSKVGENMTDVHDSGTPAPPAIAHNFHCTPDGNALVTRVDDGVISTGTRNLDALETAVLGVLGAAADTEDQKLHVARATEGEIKKSQNRSFGANEAVAVADRIQSEFMASGKVAREAVPSKYSAVDLRWLLSLEADGYQQRFMHFPAEIASIAQHSTSASQVGKKEKVMHEMRVNAGAVVRDPIRPGGEWHAEHNVQVDLRQPQVVHDRQLRATKDGEPEELFNVTGNRGDCTRPGQYYPLDELCITSTDVDERDNNHVVLICAHKLSIKAQGYACRDSYYPIGSFVIEASTDEDGTIIPIPVRLSNDDPILRQKIVECLADQDGPTLFFPLSVIPNQITGEIPREFMQLVENAAEMGVTIEIIKHELYPKQAGTAMVDNPDDGLDELLYSSAVKLNWEQYLRFAIVPIEYEELRQRGLPGPAEFSNKLAVHRKTDEIRYLSLSGVLQKFNIDVPVNSYNGQDVEQAADVMNWRESNLRVVPYYWPWRTDARRDEKLKELGGEQDDPLPSYYFALEQTMCMKFGFWGEDGVFTSPEFCTKFRDHLLETVMCVAATVNYTDGTDDSIDITLYGSPWGAAPGIVETVLAMWAEEDRPTYTFTRGAPGIPNVDAYKTVQAGPSGVKWVHDKRFGKGVKGSRTAARQEPDAIVEHIAAVTTGVLATNPQLVSRATPKRITDGLRHHIEYSSRVDAGLVPYLTTQPHTSQQANAVSLAGSENVFAPFDIGDVKVLTDMRNVSATETCTTLVKNIKKLKDGNGNNRMFAVLSRIQATTTFDIGDGTTALAESSAMLGNDELDNETRTKVEHLERELAIKQDELAEKSKELEKLKTHQMDETEAASMQQQAEKQLAEQKVIADEHGRKLDELKGFLKEVKEKLKAEQYAREDAEEKLKAEKRQADRTAARLKKDADVAEEEKSKAQERLREITIEHKILVAEKEAAEMHKEQAGTQERFVATVVDKQKGGKKRKEIAGDISTTGRKSKRVAVRKDNPFEDANAYGTRAGTKRKR